MSPDASNQVLCRECGQLVPHFLPKHLQAHTVTVDGQTRTMTVDDYLRKHPGAPTLSAALLVRLSGKTDPSLDRPGLLPGQDVRVPIAGVQHRVHLGVPREACLPAPPHYKPPQLGQAGKAMFHLSLVLHEERAIYIHGETGSGKDAAIHYFSAATQRPCLLVQIVPKVDLRPWISVRGFKNGETVWEDGPLTRAVRDGYGADKVPYMILFTDIDRAEADQAENLRMMLDSIQGRIVTPGGSIYPVLPGTQFVATANTVGSGDGAALYVSAKPQDISILGRFPAKIQWWDPEVDDALPSLREAYPDLSEGDFFSNLRLLMLKLRAADVRTTGAIFSMRDAHAVCGHARRLNRVAAWSLADGARITLGALRVWLGGLADDQRLIVRSVLKTHFPTNLPNEEDMP